uniref:dUTPase-like domain-containing protein n=1 Tax=viral metagenome TaxID=1070528 RepID=A0A6C0E3E1_9ZZZZ
MSEPKLNTLLFKLLGSYYDKVMVLKVYVDTDDNTLRHMYYAAADNHNEKMRNNPFHIDAGFDLFAPGKDEDDELTFFYDRVNKLDFKISCSATMYTDNDKSFNTGYYMYPRSSISKTQLRLANSVGIIDAGYRGHLIGMFDVVGSKDYFGKKFDRYAQICAPGLVPIVVEIVETKEDIGLETSRGENGLGSSGR